MDRPEPRSNSDRVLIEDILEHHGIKGQHWGVRRKNPSGASPSSDDHERVSALRTQRKSGGTRTLSNKELQDLITRLNLERQVKQLDPTAKEAVVGFLGGLLKDTGKQQVSRAVNDAAAKQVAGALKK
jgi:hypothetical protein